jgi:hypothetical protein
MSPAPPLEAGCNDVRERKETAIEFLQYAARGHGEFVSAADTYADVGSLPTSSRRL